MLNNARATLNSKKHTAEPFIYLNKSEAQSLWTDDAYREKLMQLCSPQATGIKRLRDLEFAVIKLLSRISPATKRTLGHAGGLAR
jgi:hypothetical protein